GHPAYHRLTHCFLMMEPNSSSCSLQTADSRTPAPLQYPRRSAAHRASPIGSEFDLSGYPGYLTLGSDQTCAFTSWPSPFPGCLTPFPLAIIVIHWCHEVL